jgi:hypothetical protein
MALAIRVTTRAAYGRQLPPLRRRLSSTAAPPKPAPAAAPKRPPLLHRLRPAVSAAAHRLPLAVQRVLSMRRSAASAALLDGGDGVTSSSLPADVADLLAQLAACPARQLNDALTQPAGQLGEPLFVVAALEHARAGGYVNALVDGVLLRRLPELGTPARAALVLALRHVGARAAPPGFSGLPAAYARALVRVVCGTHGGQLGALKDALNVCGPECDLFSLVYRDVGSPLLRYQLLQHFAAEAGRALSSSTGGGGGTAPSRPVQLVTDFDDTLACMWVDARFYPRGTVYPGVTAFVAELHGTRWPLATAGAEAAASQPPSSPPRLPPGWWSAMLSGPRAAPPAAAVRLRIDDVDDAVGDLAAHASTGSSASHATHAHAHYPLHHHTHGHHHLHHYLQQHIGGSYFVASDGDGLPRPPDDADGDVAAALSPQRPPARLRAAAQRFRDAYRRRWRGLLAGSGAQPSLPPPPPPPAAVAADDYRVAAVGEPLSPTRRRYHAARAWLGRQAAASAVSRQGRHLLRRGLESFYTAAGRGKPGPAPRLPTPRPPSTNGGEAATGGAAATVAADAGSGARQLLLLPAPTSLVVLTARPADYRGLVKQATLAKLQATGLGVGLELDRLPGDGDDGEAAAAAAAAAAASKARAGARPPAHAIVLLGSLLRSTSTAAIASKKGDNLDAYRCLWPEAAFVLLGDSGQGDTAVAAAALSAGGCDPTDGGGNLNGTALPPPPPPLAPVVGAFIHDVTPGAAVTGDGGAKAAYADRYGPRGLAFFTTYAGAAGLAAGGGLLSPDAAVRVARAAVADLTRVRWDGAPKLPPPTPPPPGGAPAAPTSAPDRAKAAAVAALVADLRAHIVPLLIPAAAAPSSASSTAAAALESLLPPGLLDDDPLWRAAVREGRGD